MKKLPLPMKIAGFVFIVTVLSFLICFSPMGGLAGICKIPSIFFYPVMLLVTFSTDILARFHIINLRHSNIFLLLTVGSILWSLAIGMFLARFWKKLWK